MQVELVVLYHYAKVVIVMVMMMKHRSTLFHNLMTGVGATIAVVAAVGPTSSLC